MRFKFCFKSDIMFTSFNTLSSLQAKCQVLCISLISEILIQLNSWLYMNAILTIFSSMKARNYFVRISYLESYLVGNLKTAYWKKCSFKSEQLFVWQLISQSFMQRSTVQSYFNAVLQHVFSVHMPSQSLYLSVDCPRPKYNSPGYCSLVFYNHNKGKSTCTILCR